MHYLRSPQQTFSAWFPVGIQPFRVVIIVLSDCFSWHNSSSSQLIPRIMNFLYSEEFRKVDVLMRKWRTPTNYCEIVKGIGNCLSGREREQSAVICVDKDVISTFHFQFFDWQVFSQLSWKPLTTDSVGWRNWGQNRKRVCWRGDVYIITKGRSSN